MPARPAVTKNGNDEEGRTLTKDRLKKMLADVASGSVSVEEAFERLRALPYEKVAGAHVDHHRGIRQGVPEVIFGEGKTTEQIVTIARSMRKAGTGVLITRLSDEKMRALRKRLRGSQSHPKARCMVVRDGVPKILGKGTVLVVTAGTSDIPVAEEAAVTAEFLGNRVDRLFDVGVAGIHRILLQQDRLRGARVIFPPPIAPPAEAWAMEDTAPALTGTSMFFRASREFLASRAYRTRMGKRCLPSITVPILSPPIAVSMMSWTSPKLIP